MVSLRNVISPFIARERLPLLGNESTRFDENNRSVCGTESLGHDTPNTQKGVKFLFRVVRPGHDDSFEFSTIRFGRKIRTRVSNIWSFVYFLVK